VSPPRVRRARALLLASRRARPSARAILAVGARRALVGRALMGGGIAAAALGGYGVYRGVKRIKRANARRRAVAKTGITRIASPSKNINQIDQEPTTINNNTWSAVDLCAIPANPANLQNASRSGKWAHISGIRHKAIWVNQTAVTVRVYQYWIIPRQYRIGITDADIQNEFFSATGNAADGDDNWNALHNALNYDRPVNSEKYTVLKKMVTTLGPGVETTPLEQSMVPSIKSETMWIPINRKYTYEQVAGEGDVTRTEQPPVFWVSWCNRMSQGSGQPAVATVTRAIKLTTYFRDGDT